MVRIQDLLPEEGFSVFWAAVREEIVSSQFRSRIGGFEACFWIWIWARFIAYARHEKKWTKYKEWIDWHLPRRCEIVVFSRAGNSTISIPNRFFNSFCAC